MVDEKKRKINIVGGIVLSYVYFAISIGLSLYFDRYVLKNLGDVEYGLNSFVSSITSWLSLLTFGLSSTYVRFATICKKKEGEIGLKKINGFYFLFIVIACLLASLIGFVICFLFFTNKINLSQYTETQKVWINELLVVSVISTIVSFLANFLAAYASYKEQFIWLRSLDILTKVGTVVASILAIRFGGDIFIVSIVSCAVQIIISIANCIYCFFVIKLRISFGDREYLKKQCKDILTFSFYVFLNIIMNEANTALGKTVLGIFDNATSVAVFNIGLLFYTYSNQLTSAISTSYVPQVNSLVVNGEDEKVDNLFVRVSTEQAVIMMLIFGGFLSCGKEFILAWVGPSKIQSYYIGSALLLVASVPFSQNIGIEIQRAYNKQKFRSIFYTAMAVLNVLLTLLLVITLPDGQKVYGATAGIVISLFFGTWIAINIYYRKALRLSVGLFWRRYLILLVVSLADFLLVNSVVSCFNTTGLSYWVVFFIRGFSYTIFYVAAVYFIFKDKAAEFFRKIKSKIKHN